jgi:phage host-nuclease inhibitor protein Gam
MSGAALRAVVAVVSVLLGTFALVAVPVAQELQLPPSQQRVEPGPSPTGGPLQAVADVIGGWDGRDVGALFVAVKATNPEKGAIDTIRELNKAIKEKKTTLGDAEAAAISKKLAAAQAVIKEKIIAVRRAAFAKFAEAHPDLARTFSSVGDVGSWPTSDDINSDVDWTVFGTDPAATRRFVEMFYDPMLLTALAGDGSGLDLRADFDIVVTPEGWERKAGVFETSGGKALAKTVMSRVIPINADGTLGTATGTDVAAELENTKVQARLRELATKMGVYDQVFDAKGNFRGYGAFQRSQFPTGAEIEQGFKRVGRDPATDAAIDAFLEAADEEGLLRYDSKIVRRSTLAGTCLDMAKHLHHEAIEKLGTLDKKGQIKRIMKYPGRSEWAYGKSSIPGPWVEDYVVMGDPKIRRLVELSAAFHKAKESKPKTPTKTAGEGGEQDPSKPADIKPVNEALERMIAVIADEYPDSHELGRLAETMIIRQAHLAMQVQLDEIVRSADPAERGRMLQALIDDFGVVDEAGPFQAFAQAQRKALTEFKKVSDDPAAFEKLKATYQALDTLSDPDANRNGERLRGFLKQSELGGRLLEIHDRAKDLADRVKKQTDRMTVQLGEVAVTIETVGDHLRETSQLFRLVENAKQDLDAIRDVGSMPTADLQSILDGVGTAVDLLQAIGDAKTDADLAYNLGKALWDNSGVGGIVNTLYAFTVGGDNEAMGKFVMFALCPPAAIPELVGKIGNFTARSGAQKLFDMQLEALYAASRFAGDPPFVDAEAWKDKDPWLLADFVGYGAGVRAVEDFLDTLLMPGGYREAESMIVTRVSNLLSETVTGGDVLMKAAVVKAIWVTLMLGDPVVLGDDADLAAAAQRVKLLTDDIVQLAAQLGKEVARAPENFALPDGLSKGEQAALMKLVAERDVWVGKAKTAMAAAIVRTFEERHRADGDLSGKEMEKRMEELRALLTRLDVLEPGLYHLGEEGYFNFLQRHLPFFGRSNTEQQRKLMTAINRYFDAYSQILSLRDAVTQIIQIRTAAAPAKPPLTGAPPLCGERSIDLSAALGLFERIGKAGEATTTTLTNLKGAPLAGPFDVGIRHKVDAAAIDMARAEIDGEVARACRELHWKSEVIDRNRFTEDSAASTTRFAEAQQRHQAAVDEFIAYYAALKALRPTIELKPSAPVQGDSVTATLTVTGGTVPAEAVWVWTLDDDGRKSGSWRGTTITFEAPFRGRYTLTAALTLSGVAVKTASRVFTVTARPGATVRLVPPDPPPEGTIDAEARFEPAPTPAGAEWEWRCEGCAVIASKGERARLKAPAKGAGTVRVRLLAADGGARKPVAEASAPFRVDETKKPDGGTSSQDGATPPVPPTDTSKGTDDTTPPPGPDDKTKPPGDTDAKKPPVVIPGHELSSWYMAMLDREELIPTSRRADLSAGDRERVAAELARIEAQMKAYWDHAARELAMAVDYTARIRAEIVKVHDRFAGKTKGLMPDTGTVTDLEGETVASRNNACVQAVENNRKRDLGYVDDDLVRLRGFHALFVTYSPERSVYYEAMRGHDNVSVDHDKTRWKTRGYERTFYDPCGGPPVKVTLPPANVPALPPPSPPTAIGAAPSVTLSLDPASKGRPEATIVAGVSGGRAPYAFAWAGAKSSNGGRAVYIRPIGKGTPVKAEVRVADAAGRTTTATLSLDPVAIDVQLVKTSPAGGELPVGAKAGFEVRLSGEGGSIDARAFVLRWEPSTEATFEKAEGAGLTANTATWSRTGKTRVWVSVLQRQGAALVTVGESNQIELDVTGSAVDLEARPADPLVGQEVSIRAREKPSVADGEASWWWEAKGEVSNAGPTADPRVYTFVARTAGPITVTTHLKENLHGDELATASKTVTVRPYEVSVVALGPAFENTTTRPVVWRPGKGLVTLDREILPDTDVGFRADIAPTPATSQLRYLWRVQDGASLTGNPVSRETRARRSDAGSIAVTVEIRDADDVLLGRGSGSAMVSVSAADLATGRQKTADLERLKREAARAWSSGDLETACRSARAAAAIDPGFAEARTRCVARDTVAGLVRDAEAGLGEKSAAGLDRAKKRIAEIRAINAAAKVIADLEKRRAATKIEDPKTLERKRRMDRIRAGAEACTKADWQTCRTSIAGALDGGEGVFEPADAGTIAKAHSLLDRANRALAAAAKADADRDADRDRRRAEILAGARLCGDARWRECRDRLAAALGGAETVFRAEDVGILAKARALLDRADRMSRATPPATDGRTDAATPGPQGRANDTSALPNLGGPGRPVSADDTTTPASPSAAVAAVTGFDGVYVGRSKSHGGALAPDVYTWIVSGGRMEVRIEQEVIANGTVRPNGEFTFANAETTAGGRIVGDALTGTYERRTEGRIDDAGTFEAHRDASGRSPGAMPKEATPERGIDGVYRGRAVHRGKETSHLVFEVTGSRVVLRMEDDPQKRSFEGAVRPTGEFVVAFPNNTYRGRIANGSLEGTWTLRRGVLGDAGASGTFRARR